MSAALTLSLIFFAAAVIFLAVVMAMAASEGDKAARRFDDQGRDRL